MCSSDLAHAGVVAQGLFPVVAPVLQRGIRIGPTPELQVSDIFSNPKSAREPAITWANPGFETPLKVTINMIRGESQLN